MSCAYERNYRLPAHLLFFPFKNARLLAAVYAHLVFMEQRGLQPFVVHDSFFLRCMIQFQFFVDPK